MNAKNKATELYTAGLIIAKHYTFPHAEHGLAKDIALQSIKQAKDFANANLKGWLDSDVLSFWDEVEKEVRAM